MKPWVSYSLLRLAIFAATFAILMLLQVDWLISAAIAAVVGLCVSYIFFGDLRRRMADDLQKRRETPVTDGDSRAEDAAEDEADAAAESAAQAMTSTEQPTIAEASPQPLRYGPADGS